ncbi:MAG: tetratricopeptide repeat protein, partial [Cyanobacteria bacterium P01_F01_bin.4]
MNWIIGTIAPALACQLAILTCPAPATATRLLPASNGPLPTSNGHPPTLIAQPAPIETFTLTGELTPEDETLPDGSYARLHPFEGVAGQQVTIDLISDDFDAFVLLVGPNEILVGQDDDGGEGTHARLSSILTETGTYQIVVNTAQAGEMGQYTLTVGPASQAEREVAAANALNAQVLALYEQGRYGEALPLAQQALEQWRRLLGNEHPQVAIALNNVAEMYRTTGNPIAAEPLYQEALAIQAATLPAGAAETAVTLNNLGLIYIQQGRYSDAEAIYQRVNAAYADGPPSVLQGRGYLNLGELYRQQGRFDEAVTALQRATEIFAATAGPASPDVALSSMNLGLIEQLRGNYGQAETLYQRAIDIYRTTFGESHPNIAIALLNLGNLYQAQSRYADTEALYEQALGIQQANYGEAHPDIVTTLGNFGQLYQIQGRYDQAETVLKQALGVTAQTVGNESPLAAGLLTRLAEVYRLAGRYGEAETTGLKALTLYEQLVGPQHPDYIGVLNNLALVNLAQGRPLEAAPRFEQAVAAFETTLGSQHPNLALMLNNWAEFYRAQGNFEAALPLYQRALEIQTAVLSPHHPDRGITLNNLGLMAYSNGELEIAIELQQKALDIFQIALGDAHPMVGLTLNNLGEAHRLQGDTIAALPLFEQALMVQQRALPPNHPELALTLNNLGLVYASQKDYVQAERSLLQALDITQTSLGDKHPHLILILGNLALLYQQQNRPAEALPLIQQNLDIQDYNLGLILSTGSETQKSAYFRTLPPLSQIVSFHLQSAADTPEAARLALLATLQRKGRVLDAVTDGLQSLRRQLAPADQALLEDWAELRSQLATLVIGGIGNQAPAAYQAQIKTLEDQSQALEKTLGDRSAQFRNEAQPITLEAIQSFIPADAGLLEFIVYQPLALDGPINAAYGPPRYAVYLLKPSGELVWRDLGETTAIDEQITEMRRALQNRSGRLQPIARNLYTTLLAPLEAELAQIDHLLISPDGQLNLMPFAALIKGEQYLLETHQITYLTSGRDLLRLQQPTASRQPAVLVANPNYETATQAAPEIALGAPPETRGTPNERAADMTNLSFGPLEGTAAEAKEIATKVNEPIVLTGAEATENVIKQLQGPRILHIATHGFFLADDVTKNPSSASPPFNSWGPRPTAGRGTPAAPSLGDPLLRSGLALAGFNARESGPEDGVLTALEAASLDLSGT